MKILDNSINLPKSREEFTFAGDILLTFHAEERSFPGRIANHRWEQVLAGKNWQIQQQSPSANWKGFPMLRGSVGEWRFWFLGELYDVSEARSDHLLGNVLMGDEPATVLNGRFLLWAWNETTGCWHIYTDRLGTLHAYFADNGKQTALSTFFPAAAEAASRRRLDWLGLTGFFGLGFFPEDRTYYEDVRILRPASHYIFDENGRLLSRKRYWHWWHQPDVHRTYEDTIAQFAGLLTEIMTDLTQDGRIALPISGGLDSRSTVAALSADHRHAAGLWPFSYGYSNDSVETRIARQVAATRNLPIQTFTITPYLFNRLDLVMAGVEGFQDVTQCRQAAVLDEISHHADYLIAAHMGDLWLDDMGLAAKEKSAFTNEAVLTKLIYKMTKEGSNWLLTHLCQPQLGQVDDPEALITGMVRRELAQIESIEEPDFRVKALKIDQWVWRWTNASLRMFQPAAFPRLPFYDTRLTDFFCTVPTAFVRRRRLQIDYLKQIAPDLAQITWQAYGTNLFRYRHFHTWLLPQRAIKKAWRLLRGKQIIQRNWEIQFLNRDGRYQLEKRLLRRGLHLHEFVSPASVKTMLDAFYAAPFTGKPGYTVSMLLSFAVWLEHYY